MTQKETEDCPFCDGYGVAVTFDRWMFTCCCCNGSGWIAKRNPEAVALGKAHREKRLARREALRDCARRLDMDVGDLVLMEKGIK